MKSETKICQNCKKDFTIEPDDFGFYEKIKVPLPTFCLDCRLQRKMIRRNERSLYKRKCNMCDKDVISMYPSASPFPVYCHSCWWSDKRDLLSYGKEYDFSKTFFKQWQELSLKFPHVALYQKNPINSPYTNHSDYPKSSYLAVDCAFSENIFYSKWVINSKDLVDCLVAFDSELCYELNECKGCSRCAWMYLSKSCIDSAFLFKCQNCIDCFLSSNIRNGKYVFKNKKLSKEEYENELKVFLGTAEGLKKAKKFFKEEILPKTLRKFIVSGKIINSSGDYLFGGSKNLKKCFHVYRSENSAYSMDCSNIKDCYDTYESAFNCELQYECHAGNRLTYSKFCSVSYDSNNLEYSEMCHGSQNCFACIGLRSKQYCILNKQYTKEEYEELVPKIIKHMNDMPYKDKKGRVYKYGEFFPSELSPFSYNETIAQEYFPLTKEEAIKQGYKWKDKEERNYKIDIKTEDIPNNIKDTDESIINKVIECEHKGTCNEQCTEAFKLIPDELKFYQRMNLPIPHLCPNCRHYQRLKQRNPLKLWHRHCMKPDCPNEFETSYAPDRPETVYCESCYNKEVY